MTVLTPFSKNFSRNIVSLLSLFLLTCILLAADTALAQTQAPVINRDRGREMLKSIRDALKEVYYDPTFHGINVDQRFKEAEKLINEAKSTWQINTIIAQVLSELNDSHTKFLPPDLVVGVSFGFQMQMIGNTCYVVRLKPGSDAEVKGLKVGDVIYSIEGFEPTRESLWKIIYTYFVLLPPPALRVSVQEANGHLHELLLQAAVSGKKRKKVKLSDRSQKPPKYYDLSEEVIVCKLPQFDLNDQEVDEMMKRIRARKVLILDLRGNPGGRVTMEQRLLGSFFDKDVKIADEKQRSKTSTLIAKTRGREKIFTGRVLILVDSKSASASELFARVMQLEKRGTVLGDATAGAVMESILASFPFQTAADWQAIPSSWYGASITIADLIMTDGKSLERTGVTPDEILLPRRADLAGKRDPLLARAAALAGVQLDAEKAGTIFPVEWEDEDNVDTEDKK